MKFCNKCCTLHFHILTCTIVIIILGDIKQSVFVIITKKIYNVDVDLYTGPLLASVPTFTCLLLL